MRDGLIPAGFDEGPINFAPTYKFDKGTDTYDTRYTSIKLPFILSLIPYRYEDGVMLDNQIQRDTVKLQ